MLAVFRRDFKAYFTSPLGYVFISAFLVVNSLYFFIVNIMSGSGDLVYMFSFIMFLMVFLTPLLTMRLISEELKQKTDQLIFTAPVSVSGFVVGKFLAAFGVFVLSLCTTLIYVLIVAMFGTLSVSLLVGNYIAILAVAMSFISIGLFMSSLTENQLVSAIMTLAAFVGLYILDMARNAFNQAIVTKVLNWISMFERYRSFTMGLFSLSDFVFYISVCAIFLFLTARSLEKKRWN